MSVQKRHARDKAWKRQRGLCFYCKRTVARHKATLDHRVPACMGGNLEGGNAAMACADCNQRKGNMPEEVFLAGEAAQRAWKWERQQAWREANSGTAAQATATEYGDLLGAACQRARAMIAVQEAKRARRGQ